MDSDSTIDARQIPLPASAPSSPQDDCASTVQSLETLETESPSSPQTVIRLIIEESPGKGNARSEELALGPEIEDPEPSPQGYSTMSEAGDSDVEVNSPLATRFQREVERGQERRIKAELERSSDDLEKELLYIHQHFTKKNIKRKAPHEFQAPLKKIAEVVHEGLIAYICSRKKEDPESISTEPQWIKQKYLEDIFQPMVEKLGAVSKATRELIELIEDSNTSSPEGDKGKQKAGSAQRHYVDSSRSDSSGGTSRDNMLGLGAIRSPLPSGHHNLPRSPARARFDEDEIESAVEKWMSKASGTWSESLAQKNKAMMMKQNSYGLPPPSPIFHSESSEGLGIHKPEHGTTAVDASSTTAPDASYHHLLPIQQRRQSKSRRNRTRAPTKPIFVDTEASTRSSRETDQDPAATHLEAGASGEGSEEIGAVADVEGSDPDSTDEVPLGAIHEDEETSSEVSDRDALDLAAGQTPRPSSHWSSETRSESNKSVPATEEDDASFGQGASGILHAHRPLAEELQDADASSAKSSREEASNIPYMDGDVPYGDGDIPHGLGLAAGSPLLPLLTAVLAAEAYITSRWKQIMRWSSSTAPLASFFAFSLLRPVLLVLTVQIYIACFRERSRWLEASGRTRQYLVEHAYRDPSWWFMPGVDMGFALGRAEVCASLVLLVQTLDIWLGGLWSWSQYGWSQMLSYSL